MSNRALFGACVCALLMSGCSLVIAGEVDDLEVNLSQLRDVSVRLVNFTPHVGQTVVIEVVRPGPPTRLLQAHAAIDPMPSECVEVRLPFGAAIAATDVDFYADIGNDGLMAPPDDHVWREQLDEDGKLVFAHAFNFTDIAADRAMPQGNDVVLDITGLDGMDGMSVVVALVGVIDLDPDPAVTDTVQAVNGVYVSTVQNGAVGPRRGAGNDQPPRLRGVADGGSPYIIELNLGNGAMRCRLDVTAPPANDLVVQSNLSAFTCDTNAPLDVFESCGS